MTLLYVSCRLLKSIPFLSTNKRNLLVPMTKAMSKALEIHRAAMRTDSKEAAMRLNRNRASLVSDSYAVMAQTNLLFKGAKLKAEIKDANPEFVKAKIAELYHNLEDLIASGFKPGQIDELFAEYHASQMSGEPTNFDVIVANF